MTTYRLGVDAGGTFTDFVVADDHGNIKLFKATSTPHDSTLAIADGLQQIAESLGRGVDEILADTELLVNGTTVALNALIQHRGVKTGLICTAGHEDSIEIRLGHKEEGHRYDAKYPPARMLVDRHMRRPVRERTLRDGTIDTPLHEEDVRAACEYFLKEGVEAVAVSFLWSVANELNERRAAEIVREMLPGIFVSVGLEVYPQMREYTRTSTAVTNAYLGPVLKGYVDRVDQFYRDHGVKVPVRYYQSNGGMASRDVMVSKAVNAINSGPSSAPQAGLAVAGPLGIDNIITVDMGGTSFDITLTRRGKTNISKNIDFLRYRIGTPMIQVETLGAGGGSIAWIDAMGLLKVGPNSAGAVPGPVCYMRGGSEPTVTDANVALGYLNPISLLGGRVPIDAAGGRNAIADRIAKPLGISMEKAAFGIYSIVNNNMVNGIRRVSIERGYDPRDFALICAGGATGLHITALAEEIGITKVIVPKLASGLCAYGQVLSDVKYNYMAASPTRLDQDTDFERIENLFCSLEQEGSKAMRRDGFRQADIRIHRSLDMRYTGQVHECTVDIAEMEINSHTIAQIRAMFDQLHEQLFTYAEPQSIVEIVNIESTVHGLVSKPRGLVYSGSRDARDAIKDYRPMIFSSEAQAVETPVYDGEVLGPGASLSGPSVIEEITTTVVLNPGWTASFHDSGSYVLTHTA